MHDGEQLRWQEVRRVGTLRAVDSKATGCRAPASSGCSRIAETASSDASVIKGVGRLGSYTLSAGADIRAAWSCSKLRDMTAVHRYVVFGLHSELRGAAKYAKPSTNLR